MAMADVTIRGAGIFGLSIAWACVLRGARVQVVDPFGPGAGSSGGLVGALAPHVPENWNAKKAFQFDSLIMAEGFWAGVEAAGGVSPGYGRTGRIQPLADERAVDLADERAENARTLWQGQAEWRVCPVDEMGSWCPPSPTGLVVHDTLSARMHPRRACAALVGALAVRGVEVLAEAPDRGQVIHATGIAGLEELNRARGRLVGTVHIVPHADGTLAIGSTSERDYDDPTSTDAALDTVLDRAMQAVPLLHGAEVIERWAGVRPRSRSRAPMLGAHPLYPDQFIANGGFKIGFGMAPKVAHVMAELVLEGQDNIPQDFRPEASL